MSVKQVISLMATTPGADEFNTGVEYGVVLSVSIFCDISILRGSKVIFHSERPLGEVFHVNRSSGCTCQLSVMTLCDFIIIFFLFPLLPASVCIYRYMNFVTISVIGTSAV